MYKIIYLLIQRRRKLITVFIGVRFFIIVLHLLFTLDYPAENFANFMYRYIAGMASNL